MRYHILFILLFVVSPLPVQAQQANLDTCATDYDADVDYFPEKLTTQYAENFSVEYFKHYKVVTVNDAYDNAEAFTYVLVQCGTPAPDADAFPPNTQFAEVPAGPFIAMSTTQLPHLTELGLLDRLVGVDGFAFINTPEVVDLIETGEIVEVGAGSDVNVELILSLEPGVVMTFGFNPATDAHPILREAGVFTALNASWREASPLGRAEWLKYTSLFYNREAESEAAFEIMATEYEAARALVADISQDERPVVLWNYFSPFSDSWTIPGADTYIAALIRDAGGFVALGDEAPMDSVNLGFEFVYSEALGADIWMTNAFGIQSVDDLLAQDARYADFEALIEGQVWNNNLDVNANGGNNYYERGVTNPHLILRDLVAMFHPERLPDHTFLFHRNLSEAQ